MMNISSLSNNFRLVERKKLTRDSEEALGPKKTVWQLAIFFIAVFFFFHIGIPKNHPKYTSHL